MARFLTILSLVAATAFIFILFALHILSPDIDPMVSGISFYALGRFGILLDLALVLVGFSGIALALALWSSTTISRLGLVLLIAWGLLSILAGLFPLDAPGSAPTLSGRIHNLAGLNFLLIAPALLLIEKGETAAEPNRPRNITTWLAWLLAAAAVLLFVFNGPLSALQVGGAFQRFYWLILVLWLGFTAWSVWLREREKTLAHKSAVVP
ncbi:MAG: DUF998 domain-containing protein [Chloroflexi bacterium]|nr:MAG: DUF998 domain-containing protein [Chloroflexota bacterium]